jgi:hypothetical protein
MELAGTLVPAACNHALIGANHGVFFERSAVVRLASCDSTRLSARTMATFCNSPRTSRSKSHHPGIESPCHARKIVDGQELYLLGMPNGPRYWRYNYRFEGRHKSLALGALPEISLEKARARHQIARTLLADGADPSDRKRASGTQAFVTATIFLPQCNEK